MLRSTSMALCLAGLVLAACGKDSSTGPAPADTGTLTMLNDSNSPIVAMYFTSCEDGSWGPNRLSASENVAPGALRSWTVEAGCYDFKASTGERSATWWDLALTPGGTVQLGVPADVDAMVAQARIAGPERKSR